MWKGKYLYADRQWKFLQDPVILSCTSCLLDESVSFLDFSCSVHVVDMDPCLLDTAMTNNTKELPVFDCCAECWALWDYRCTGEASFHTLNSDDTSDSVCSRWMCWTAGHAGIFKRFLLIIKHVNRKNKTKNCLTCASVFLCNFEKSKSIQETKHTNLGSLNWVLIIRKYILTFWKMSIYKLPYLHSHHPF